MPNEHAAWAQHAGELPDHAGIVRRVGEEPEGCEEIDHGVEASGPFVRKRAHVRSSVAQRRTGAALLGDGEQLARVVRAGDVVARLGQQMRVTPLSAGTIEDARADRELEDLEEPRDFLPVARENEERFVLQEILLVEVRLPPIVQKNTGSRYAPNTSSSAARISYSVQ